MSTTLKWAGREYECFMSNKGLRVEHLGQEIFRHWPDQATPVEPPAESVPTVDAPAEPPVDAPTEPPAEAPTEPPVEPPADTAPPSPPTSPPTADLSGAINAASDGAVINLAPGNYGNVVITRQFSKIVTINGNGATITGLKMNGAKNVVLDGVSLIYTPGPSDADWAQPFSIKGCTNCGVINSKFVGKNGKNGYGWGTGLSIGGSSGTVITGNLFTGFLRALVVGGGQSNTISGNELTSMAGDAINFTNETDLKIDGNYIHDFRADPASTFHRDAIQCFTRGLTTPPKNIRITNNRIVTGNGSWHQSIFIRNEAEEAGTANMRMTGFVVSGNVIDAFHIHGITLPRIDGLTVDSNILTQANVDVNEPQNAAAIAQWGMSNSIFVPSINMNPNSTNVTVTNNTGPLSGLGAGWTVSGNV